MRRRQVEKNAIRLINYVCNINILQSQEQGKTYFLEKDSHISQGEQRWFIAYRGRKIEDQSDQWITIGDFTFALNRGHPSGVLLFAELVRVSSVRIQVKVRDWYCARYVQIKHIEESNILVPNIRLLALDNFHIKKRLNMLEQARQYGWKREV